MHVNDPSFDYEPTCSRCEKHLTEDTISEFSMRKGQCAECYEITISDSPSMLQFHIDEIRQQLKRLDQRIYSAIDHLKVIETYLKNNCYEAEKKCPECGDVWDKKHNRCTSNCQTIESDVT